MKSLKFIAVSALLLTSTAFAGTDDGNVMGAYTRQVAAHQSAPAPIPSGAETQVQALDSGIVSPNP